MSRPKAIIPDHPWVTPQDKAKRLFQGQHEAKHENGHATPVECKPLSDDDYNPNAGN